jgi:hypothetical protein
MTKRIQTKKLASTEPHGNNMFDIAVQNIVAVKRKKEDDAEHLRKTALEETRQREIRIRELAKNVTNEVCLLRRKSSKFNNMLNVVGEKWNHLVRINESGERHGLLLSENDTENGNNSIILAFDPTEIIVCPVEIESGELTANPFAIFNLSAKTESILKDLMDHNHLMETTIEAAGLDLVG